VAGSEPCKADEVDPEGLIGLMGFSGVSWDINIVRIVEGSLEVKLPTT
jgi:hypothetical protein